jgi:probable rRNA maturation factor
MHVTTTAGSAGASAASAARSTTSDDSGPSTRGGPGDDKPPQLWRAERPASECASGPHVEIEQSGDVRQWIDAAWLHHRLCEAIRHVRGTVRRVTLCLVDDHQMILLHKRHCGLDETTDVLTFPMSNQGEPVEVEIVACTDEAFRRAQELGHCVEQELLLYALHGVLHTCGFNDLTDSEHAAMHAEEDRILELIGVGRTFDRDGSEVGSMGTEASSAPLKRSSRGPARKHA